MYNLCNSNSVIQFSDISLYVFGIIGAMFYSHCMVIYTVSGKKEPIVF